MLIMLYSLVKAASLLLPYALAQVNLVLPSAGNCNEDTVLVCEITGALNAVHQWVGPSGIPIVSNGVELNTNGKYIETVAADSFSLTIKDTVLADAGQYQCSNGFSSTTSTEPLVFQCQAVPSTTCEEMKMQILLTKIYPSSPTVGVVCKEGVISGIQSQTPNTDDSTFFDVTWLSQELKESYTDCVLTVTYVTNKTDDVGDCAPPCRLYVCYIGVYLAVLSAVVILVVYFIVRSFIQDNTTRRPFGNLCGADFLLKIVLPSCCCMVICIIIGVAICIPVEPDCDAGLGIGVPIAVVIILHPLVTVGVIACHIKCCMVVGASDEDGDKQNKIKKDENLTTNQKNGDPTDRHKKVQASHL